MPGHVGDEKSPVGEVGEACLKIWLFMLFGFFCRIEIAETKVKKLEASKITMENNVKESENNMREMVQQWKNQ